MNTNTVWKLATVLARNGVVPMPQLSPRKTLQLDASVTLGLDDPTLEGHFQWELIAAPDGSASPLQGADAMRVQFTPDIAGRYLIRLNASTVRGETHHVIRVCAGEDATIALTTLELKASPLS